MNSLFQKLFSTKSVIDYKALVQAGAIIIDVRSSAEFGCGHIKGSINIPLDQISNKAADLKKKYKTIITCCRSGNRSGIAKSILTSAGIACYNGGAWNVLNTKL